MTVSYIFYVIWIVTSIGNRVTSADQWYLGCVTEDLQGQEVPGNLSPIQCAQQCYNKSSMYTGVQERRCICLHNLTSQVLDHDQDVCNTSCSYEGVTLPCGSSNVTSIYNTRGPYLLNMSVTILMNGFVRHPIGVGVVVNYAGPPGMALGFPGSLDTKMLNYMWRWTDLEMNSTHEKYDRKISEENVTQMYNADEYTFDKPGQYIIDIEVSNGLSSLANSSKISLMDPAPLGLQVALITPATKLPSCIPSNQNVSLVSSEAKYIFAGQEVKFEAAVNVGSNLTFDWLFIDGGSQGNGTLKDGECGDDMCSKSFMWYKFEEVGQYEVRVKGQNELGQVEASIELIAISNAVHFIDLKLHHSSNRITPPNKTTTFVVVLETAYRIDTFVEVNYGNGGVHNYSIEEKDGGGYVGLSPETPGNHIYVSGSYGDRCRLMFELSDSFKSEGNYSVSVTVYNDRITPVVKTMDHEVIVVNELKGAAIISDSVAVALGSSVEYNVDLSRGSKQPIMYQWSVELSQELLHRYNTSDPNLTQSFARVGEYSISVTAMNWVSAVATSWKTQVEVPISGIELTVLHNNNNSFFKPRGHILSLLVTVKNGTNLVFNWNPKDKFPGDLIKPLNKTNSSQANYTLDTTGEYNISVVISNQLGSVYKFLPNKVVVQEEIKGLTVILSNAIARNEVNAVVRDEVVTLQLSVTQGSHVKFDVDYGSGRERVNEIAQGKSVNTEHRFTEVGDKLLLVHATNEVSEKSQKVELYVEERVPPVTLAIVSPVLVEKEYSTFLVKTVDGSKVVNLSDVVFSWYIDKQEVMNSGVPMLTYKFEQSGQHNITVLVYNLVSRGNATLQEKILPSSNATRFNMETYYSNEDKIKYKILFLPTSPIEIHMNYNNDQSNIQKVSEGQWDWSWEDSCTTQGLYKVSANCVSSDQPEKNQYIETYICCQERIKGVEIQGPTRIRASSDPVLYTWTCVVKSGTDLLYNWSLDGSVPQALQTYNKFQTKLHRAGTYTLKIEAINGLGNNSASVNILVIHPVTSVVIVPKPVILGNQSEFIIMVKGGLHFDFMINFGDGTPAVKKSSKDMDDDKVVPAADKVEYNITLYHKYEQIGDYNVTINVTNHVSSMEAMASAHIEEPIGVVEIRFDSKRIIALNQWVVIEGSVSTGRNLKFEWVFGKNNHDAKIRKVNRTTTAEVSFKLPGIYPVFLRVSNNYYPHPVVSQQPIVFTVEKPVEGLIFNEVSGKNAAPLYEDKQAGGFRTKEIRFYGEVEAGSNVKFLFDFGDGSVTEVNQTIEVHNEIFGITKMIRGYAIHSFTANGEFKPTLKAYNKYNEVSVKFPKGGTFYVQTEPKGLTLGQVSFTQRVNEEVKFTASVTHGSLLQFDWFMGDQTEYKDGGTVVKHTYRSAGKFNLMVMAYNQVNNDTFKATVTVIKLIQGVSFSVNKAIHKLRTQVEFTADVVPDQDIVTTYRWHFGDGTDVVHMGPMYPSCKGNMKTEVCQYKKKGTYIVSVYVSNDLSNATSDPIKVQVVEAITGFHLDIHHGEVLTNSSIHFKAYSYSGSDIMYHWTVRNVSDHNDVIIHSSLVSSNILEYTFPSIGIYNVSVRAENPLGNVSAWLRVFVLDKVCKPPVLQTLQIGETGKRFNRSEDIKIEVTVKINCSITKAALYSWKINNSSSPFNEVNLPSIDRNLFNDRILYLPGRSLEYGKYTVSLEVEMYKTPIKVYSKAQVLIHIVESPLRSVISGGIRRSVSRHETLTMDGSHSYDPDFPDSNDLSYTWACCLMGNKSSGCFNRPSEQVLTNQSVQEIPASLFLVSQELEFNLTVTKNGRNSTSLQVIMVEEQELLDVKLTCSVCEDQLVNADQRIVLEASHSGYNEDQLEYEWTLFRLGGSTTTNTPDTPGACKSRVQNNFQAWKDVLPTPAQQGKDTRIAGGSTSSAVVTTTTTQTSTTPSTVTKTTTSMTTTTTTTPRPANNGDMFPFGGGEGDADQGRGDPVCGIVGCSGGGVGEGPNPGGRGDAGLPGGNPGIDPDKKPEDDPEDPLRDDKEVSIAEPHILTLKRNPLALRDRDTVTGIGKRVLVIRTGVLKQNVSYIMEVKVKHKEKNLKGEALSYFRVNTSPYNGQCSMGPTKGVEMETQFIVYCQGWIDQDIPLRYEVSYNFSHDLPSDLVYQGLNHEIGFKLPAGRKDRNYKVDVSVHISDSLGAKTYVCKTQVTVKPKTFNTTEKTEEQILYELVQENNSSLSDYIQEGDNRNARLHAQIVANRLNRLKESENENHKIRQKIRRAMLWALKDLPLRDEYEIQQTTAAVALTTEKTQELNEDSLSYASNILNKAGKQTYDLANNGRVIESQLTAITAQGTSNILAAVSRPNANLTKEGIKEIVVNSTQVLQRILHADTSQLVVGELPVTKQYDNIQVIGSRYSLDQSIPDEIQSNAAKFSLPGNIGKVIRDRSKVKKMEQTEDRLDEGCFETQVVTYKLNPFVYLEKGLRQIQTKVVSLSILSCDGVDLELHNLDSSEEFHIDMSHDVTQSDRDYVKVLYTLHKHQMNYHVFNITANNTSAFHGETVSIDIDVVPVKEGRVFPISVLIRAEEPPTPSLYDLIYSFPLGQDVIRISIPPGTLNGSLYYLSLADSHFNSFRPRQGEVQTRQYTLRLWHASCVYWDGNTDRWSNQGCSIDQNSTFYNVQCSCNHLTSFGAHFSLQPNDLNFKDIDDFFNLNENPVTFSLISTIFGVYIVLLIVCIRLDNRDESKGAPIFLIDNTAKDKQMYVLTFETGFRKNAGTTAKVSVILHGDECFSETRELISQTGQTVFDRNSRDTFILTLPNSLGPINKVQLWHDNTGSNPSWYLSRLTVKHINMGLTYHFNSERWFAVDFDDGKVEKEITVTEGGLGFTNVLWAKGTQYFADYHIWFSTMTRPSYSRFTRAQRLTCCLSLLMSYMAVNAMWYRQTDKQEFRGEFGLIDISWRSLVVGVVTSLIVLPVNGLIVLIFRRTQVKKPDVIDEPAERRKALGQPYPESNTSLDSTSRLLHPNTNTPSGYTTTNTPSIFDQSILNWQNLQEWAQRTWAKRYRNSPNGSTQNVQPPIQTLHMSPQMEKIHALQQQQQGHHGNQGRERKSDPISDKSHVTRYPGDDAMATRLCDLSSNGTSLASECVCDTDIYFNMRSNKPERCFVPWCFRYFAWLLCILVISGCAAVTVLYGFRFGRLKSTMWLQSLFFSFIQCVFITHPVLIILMSVYIALKYRNNMSIFDHHDDGVSADIDAQLNIPSLKRRPEEEVDLQQGIAARQRSRYLRFARPPHEKSLTRSRNQTIKEKKASSVFNESLGFVVLFVLLALMAFGKPSLQPGYRLTHTLTDLLTGPHFADINTVPKLWSWVDAHFTEVLYSQNKAVGDNGRNNIHGIRVENSHLIGQVHIRQHRVLDQPCFLPTHLYSLTPYCRYGYTTTSRDTLPFGHNGTWVYFTDQFTGSQGVKGRHGDYGGDGYLVMLSNDGKVARNQLTTMQHSDWIDKFTRAVVIEFTLFHPATHLFTSVQLLFELPSVGRVFPLHRVTSGDLYKYYTSWDNFILACELLFIVGALLKLRAVVVRALAEKGQYVRSLWNTLDAIFVSVSLGYCGCYVYRFVIVGTTVEQLRSTYKEDFVDMAPVAFWDQILRTFLGLLNFVVVLQVLKILRHRKTFAVVGSVLSHAALDIFVVFLLFSIWIAAYTSLGLAMFGAVSPAFHTLDSALLSTVGLYTQHYPSGGHPGTWEAVGGGGVVGVGSWWWRLFVVSFLVAALGSMTAYTIAVLNFHYKVYKDKPKLVLSVTSTVKYYWDQFLHWFGLKPIEFPTVEEKLPTICTVAELMYQVEEMLFKINSLAGTANLPEKPHIQTVFTDSDTTYGSGGQDNMYGESHPDPDHLWIHNNVEKLNSRIQRIEDNLLLTEPHLAQLLNLDPRGDRADMLAREREKQLRNQLELEIFRQLQFTRHSLDVSGGGGSSAYPSSLSDQGPPSTGSYQGSASQSGSSVESQHSVTQDSGNVSPKSDGGAIYPKPEDGLYAKSESGSLNPKSAADGQMKSTVKSVVLEQHPGLNAITAKGDPPYNTRQMKPTKSREATPYKALLLQQPTSLDHPCQSPTTIPSVHSSNGSGIMINGSKASEKDVFPKKVGLQTSGSSDGVGSSTSSGGHEVQSLLSGDSAHGNQLIIKHKGGQGNQPPKKCSSATAHKTIKPNQGHLQGHMLHKAPVNRGQGDFLDGGECGHVKIHSYLGDLKQSTDVKPKTPPLHSHTGSSNPAVTFTYDNSIYDDSSDSDLDDLEPSNNKKSSDPPRCLRKTKSRGKGKGGDRGGGGDVLGFTNGAYLVEGGREQHRKGQGGKEGRSKHRKSSSKAK